MLRLELSGLLVAIVVIDVIARLAVPASLLFLTSGAASYAAVAAGLVSVLAVIRGVFTGLHVERTVGRGWLELTQAAATCPLEDLTNRSPSASPHPLMEAAFHTIDAVAVVFPRLVADGLGLVLITLYVATALSPRWLLVGLALACVLSLVMMVARRAFRREEGRGFEHLSELSRDLDVLLSAAVEVRGQGCEHAMSRRVRTQALAMAAAQRRATMYSALLGLLPLGIVLLGASGSSWRGLISQEARAVAQLVVVGGAATAFVISGMRSIETWVRSGPKREAYVSFTNQVTPETDHESMPACSWRDVVVLDGVTVVHPGSERATPAAVTHRWDSAGMAIVGDNGAGKTSLVHLLLGLLRPTEGSVTVGGQEATIDVLLRLRQKVVFVPQRPYVAADRSVGWHLRLFADEQLRDEDLIDALDRVELLPTLRRHVRDDIELLSVRLGELSAGETRRVHLARAFLKGAANLVVLDEPEASLDSATRRRMVSWLRGLSEERRVLLVVHDDVVVPESFDRLELTARAANTPT